MKKRRKIQLFLLDLLYPNQCPCCHRKIPWNRYLCDMCQTLFQLPPDTFCPGCGKPVESCFCERGLAYDHAIAAALYQEPARSGILSLKRAESKNFAYACGEVLGRMVIADPELLAYDLIVPVPMAKRKKKKRFFNPAEEIAREMSSATGIPLRADLLEDTGTGAAQHTLFAKERAANTGHFQIPQTADLTGYRILLCDDVLTTGSTMNRCAELLKSRGAAVVTAAAATTTPAQEDG